MMQMRHGDIHFELRSQADQDIQKGCGVTATTATHQNS